MGLLDPWGEVCPCGDPSLARHAILAKIGAREAPSGVDSQNDDRSRHELRQDLLEMTSNWDLARRARLFLDAAEEALGDGKEEGGVREYLAWARAEVDRMDPLVLPKQIPKFLEPQASG